MPGQALRILIVEDQFLIAKQLEMILTGAGHDVIGITDTHDSACGVVVSSHPDMVFLDVSLSDGTTGLDVARVIRDTCDAHIVFTTANRRRIPSDYCGAVGVVEKPFTRAGILAAITYLSARIRQTCESLNKPDSLNLSPHYQARWRQAGG